MPWHKPHSHLCQRCGAPTECGGSLEPNYDGWPAVICPAFHLPSGMLNPDFLCDECAKLLLREAAKHAGSLT